MTKNFFLNFFVFVHKKTLQEEKGILLLKDIPTYYQVRYHVGDDKGCTLYRRLYYLEKRETWNCTRT